MAIDQQQHWDEVYTQHQEFFGAEPSAFARQALDRFRAHGVTRLLELGPGQGRDTLYFAANGLDVVGLDYSERSVRELNDKVRERSLDSRIQIQPHDVRRPLPFADNSFDACYAHMLLCMELGQKEIAFVLREIHRVLRPGGLAVYSVRSVFDPHYGHGGAKHIGGQMYEIEGFVIHFFSEEMIRKFARGFEITAIGRLEEGTLPRDLFAVCLKKAGPIDQAGEEENMPDLFGSYDTVASTPAAAPGRT